MKQGASRALVVPATLAVVVAVLVAAGQGTLAAPPLGSLDELKAWVDATDTVTAVLTIVRVVTFVVAVWLLVVTLIDAVARLAGRARLVAAADRALPAPLRRVLVGLAGAGAASVVVLGGGGGPVADDPTGAVPVGERLVLLPDDGTGTATMSVLPSDADAGGVPTPASTTTPAPSPAAAPDTWTVAPGDSFWSIAEEVLTDAWSRLPTDAEIDPYWRALIAANRERIISGNPDLIFPGQVFVLPAV